MDSKPFSFLANVVISKFEEDKTRGFEKSITVNPVVSAVASWYEKIRTAMEYGEEEVILRSTIERILKRRLLLGASPEDIAEPLVRELVWARYFADGTVSESVIGKVEEKISLYLKLRESISRKRELTETKINEWFYHLLSSDLEHILNQNKETEVVANFMFKILEEQIVIEDDSAQARDIQVFIAVRRAFAKDDLAFLRFHLFNQIFGGLSSQTIEKVSGSFYKAYQEIQRQLNYPQGEKIYNYVRKKAAVFFILEDILRSYRGGVRKLVKNEEEFKKIVFGICEARYSGIAAKVRRAIIRSVIFILLTKAIFAFVVEGTYENLAFGKLMWGTMIINIAAPPLLMVIIGLLIKTPGRENSIKIFEYLKKVLYDPKPRFDAGLVLKKNPIKIKPVLNLIFSLLWLLAFILSFGLTIVILNKLSFNILSQAIFIFFLAIVSFLSYRISLIPKTYIVEEKTNFVTPIVDFFFMPIIKVGRKFTEGISQINIFLFIFDFVIETPFKGLFSFFEQWFLFLHTKRENLG